MGVFIRDLRVKRHTFKKEVTDLFLKYRLSSKVWQKEDANGQTLHHS